MWKVLLSGRKEGQYERLEADSDGMTILPDTIFAPTNNHLYVLSGRSTSVVRIVIKTLPELPHNAQYRCVFGNATPIYANVMKEGLLCTISPVNERPTIGDGLDPYASANERAQFRNEQGLCVAKLGVLRLQSARLLPEVFGKQLGLPLVHLRQPVRV
uniref:Plexin TIG domain-containing protein n=1 Tax=Anopheles atroparvus TaxID=41427 RepID=A0A182IUT7_ANOAO